jgi:maltose alpha-D-glucosyltransferase/alpha-amylase
MSSSQPEQMKNGGNQSGLTEIPELHLGAGAQLTDDQTVSQLAALLPEFLNSRRWYRAKARNIERVEIDDVVSIPEAASYILVIRVRFREQDVDTYLLPITAASGLNAPAMVSQVSDVVAHFRQPDGATGLIYGALWKQEFANALLTAVACDSHFEGRRGEFVATRTRAFDRRCGDSEPALQSTVSKAEQSNSSIIYADRYILKLFRKVEPGVNPDLEIGKFLTDRGFKHTPAVLGTLEHRGTHAEPMAAGILQAFVRNQGDAWAYTLNSLSAFFNRVLGQGEGQHAPGVDTHHPLELMRYEISDRDQALIGTYLESARLLGRRTAEMHDALADPNGGPDFVPERFTSEDGQKLFEDMHRQAETSFEILRQSVDKLSGTAAESARRLLALEPQIRNRFESLRQHPITAARIRHHGDFHLGQVLYTGSDFMIIDFEGEPARPLSERRLKTLVMRDVAGMIRSFQYAAYAALFGQVPGVAVEPGSREAVESWAAFWTAWVSATYLKGYFDTARNAPFMPAGAEEQRIIFDAFLLQKALYEVAYELNNRPGWVGIPLRGILSLVG